jgi:hypothetical protein
MIVKETTACGKGNTLEDKWEGAAGTRSVTSRFGTTDYCRANKEQVFILFN